MIEIKQLRIGSHVRIGGKTHRVSAIDRLNRQIGIEVYKTDGKGVKHALGYKIEDVEPIPLTAELLQELGFEKEETSKPGDIELSKGDITLSLYTRTSWELEIDSDEYYSIYILTHIKYLHELEHFVYLTIGKELVE